ncbi:DUF523 domain-containing protein [Thiovibrio frasassiensis]|jgi:uncharacterized protein YbbK (DUF523 family)|uniref:DUF523 domain-containing protein n=1 Tax=Thiovibrio frasassiensis TaxID=2984131 RepID=A0A9X4MFQ2_9BACT|nr:DUF523 domain-containing protein [Thiovibrio frasassiensis]MDG4475518.1 DUF523 domain-containing protein [Thiovibrio frasassiensis]
MDTPTTIGISACLIGLKTRYDGGHRREQGLMEFLAGKVTLIPLCPEAECGLGIPREPMQLEGKPENPRLITITSRCDRSEEMLAWTTRRLETLGKESIVGLILKARSPSCGKRVPVHGAGKNGYSPGLFAHGVMARFPDLPIADEEELRDPARLADFLKHVTAEKKNTREKPR